VLSETTKREGKIGGCGGGQPLVRERRGIGVRSKESAGVFEKRKARDSLSPTRWKEKKKTNEGRGGGLRSGDGQGGGGGREACLDGTKRDEDKTLGGDGKGGGGGGWRQVFFCPELRKMATPEKQDGRVIEPYETFHYQKKKGGKG